MTKTLADMTPEQRTECVGMWCYLYDRTCDDFGEPEPPTFEGIIAGYEGDQEVPVRVLVRHPDPEAPLLEYEPGCVQPRFDLPRAWIPDGSPFPAARETITGLAGMNLEDSKGDSFPSVHGTLYPGWQEAK